MYESVVRLYGGESAWPDADDCMWLTKELKVAFFVLAYFLSGCDFLSAIQGLSFRETWLLLLKALRTKGLFPSAIIGNRAGRPMINSEEVGS